MSARLRLVLAQLDFMVGDVQANAVRIIEAATAARDRERANCIVFPELALTGYPPEDLLLRPALIDQVMRGLTLIRNQVSGIDIVLGCPLQHEGRLYNAAALVRGGAIVAAYYKHRLPNYSVFDALRYFTPGTDPCVVTIGGIRIGVSRDLDRDAFAAVGACKQYPAA
jgi:NAD+ synthase (glutamine-hydrolysing)